MTHKKIILIDFDGTVHSYTSGWQAADVANDPPVPGAIAWVRSLIADDRFDPQIYSSRSRQEGGVLCMKEWFIRHGMPVEEADALRFPTEKPAAFLTIDDRAICFEGVFPALDAIDDFMRALPTLKFEAQKVDAYPTELFGAVQHNALWDARALRHKLTGR